MNKIKWHLNTYETFWLDGYYWDVTTAKEIASKKNKRVRKTQIAPFAEILPQLKMYRAQRYIDLDIPILIVPHNGLDLPIDGWHRIRKALRNGITELPCIKFSSTEANLIKEE